MKVVFATFFNDFKDARVLSAISDSNASWENFLVFLCHSLQALRRAIFPTGVATDVRFSNNVKCIWKLRVILAY